MIWAKEETMSRAEIEAIQLSRLKDTVNRVYEKVPAYRAKMEEAGVKPEHIQTLKDLQKLPFVTKQDMRDNYPYGLFAVPRKELLRIHASSGTTGKPTVVGYTENDLEVWKECVARLAVAGGARTRMWPRLGNCVRDVPSISTLHGMEKAKGREYIKNWVAVIGDSTFMHTGINSLMNMVYNQATGTVVILDNSTTGMTGHQDHAASGKTLKGQVVPAINIYGLCRSLGIEHVCEVNAFDQAELERVIKEEVARDAVSVIITKAPCALLKGIMTILWRNRWLSRGPPHCPGHPSLPPDSSRCCVLPLPSGLSYEACASGNTQVGDLGRG
nr:thiamine pyrophosphate-dependent enzyme [Enterocloster clostridioformis]